MISNSLLKFAAGQDWHVANEDEYVFGHFGDYCFTAKTDDVLTSFFTPIAGIAPEDLIELTSWLERTRFPLKLADYEMTDNFIAIRAKDTAFSGTARQMKDFLEILTDKLKDLKVDPGLCVICGLPADELALYVGLYCRIHPDCIDKEGFDFTSAVKLEDDSEDDKVDEDDELIILSGAEGMDKEDDETDDRPDDERISALAEEFANDREQFLDDLKRICAVPSVDSPPEENAPFGRETRRALDVFLDIASGMGFKTVNVDNVAGYVEMGEGEEMVAAVGHLDVVPAGTGWDSDPFTLTIDGNRATARGVNDNKGPCLATLYAMKALKEDGDFSPKRRIRLIVGLNEEKGMECMKHYRSVEEIPVAGFTPDAMFPAIYAEKGIANIALVQERHESDAIASAHGGTAVNMVPSVFELTFKEDGESRAYEGVSAHASMPELGVNAISLAMEKLEGELSERDLSDRFVTAYRALIGQETDGQSLGLSHSDETGDTTVNAGILRIDDYEARLILDIRFPVTLDLEEAKANLSEKASAYDVKPEWLSVKEPLYLGKDSHLIGTLMDVYNEATGLSGEALAIGGGTYARSLHNICGFGPSFPGNPDIAHQANEWMSIDNLLAGAAIYREALRRLAD